MISFSHTSKKFFFYGFTRLSKLFLFTRRNFTFYSSIKKSSLMYLIFFQRSNGNLTNQSARYYILVIWSKLLKTETAFFFLMSVVQYKSRLELLVMYNLNPESWSHRHVLGLSHELQVSSLGIPLSTACCQTVCEL